jgi:hypothetical protein
VAGNRGVVWGLAALGVAGAGALVWVGRQKLDDVRQTRTAQARAWDIRGPACPTMAKDAFLIGRHKSPRKFEYQGVSFYRHAGYADCASIYMDGGRSDRFYPVCQFTSPIQLMIRTRKGDWYFEPGPGRQATVSTANDIPRCVLAAKISVATVKGTGLSRRSSPPGAPRP